MKRILWGLIAPLFMFVVLTASAGSAFAAAGDVVNATYRGLATNSVLGSFDCRAMTVLPKTAPSQEDRLVCSSRAAGVDGGIDGVGGFHVLNHSGSDWIKGYPISSDAPTDPNAPVSYPLCPFTNADDVLGFSLSYLGNLDLTAQDSLFGDNYHDMSVGVSSSGTDEL